MDLKALFAKAASKPKGKSDASRPDEATPVKADAEAIKPDFGSPSKLVPSSAVIDLERSEPLPGPALTATTSPKKSSNKVASLVEEKPQEVPVEAPIPVSIEPTAEPTAEPALTPLPPTTAMDIDKAAPVSVEKIEIAKDENAMDVDVADSPAASSTAPVPSTLSQSAPVDAMAMAQREESEASSASGQKRPREENHSQHENNDGDDEYEPTQSPMAGDHGQPAKKKRKKMTPEERAEWENKRKEERERKEQEEARKKAERERLLKEKAEEKRRKEEELAQEKKRKEEERLALKKKKEEEQAAEKKRKEEEKKRLQEERKKKEEEREAEKKRKEEEREAERKRKEEEREAEKKRKEEERLQKQREKEEQEAEAKRKELAGIPKINAFFTPKKDATVNTNATVTSPVHNNAVHVGAAPVEAAAEASFYHAIGSFKAEIRPADHILVDFRRPPLAEPQRFESLVSSVHVHEDGDLLASLLARVSARARPLLSAVQARRSAARSAHEVLRVMDLSGASEAEAKRIEALLLRTRNKLLTHHDDLRPPYYGTHTKTPQHVGARRPFAKEEDLEYEEDSGEEWEEGEGEGSVIGDDDEADALAEAERGENDYDLDEDSMVVPDDYFSADEGIDAHAAVDEDAADNGDEDDEDDDPLLTNLRKEKKAASGEGERTEGEERRAQLNREKLLAKTKANLKRKAERTVMQAKLSGVTFALEDAGDDKDRRLLQRLSVNLLGATAPIATSAEPWTPPMKNKKKRSRESAEGLAQGAEGEERASKRRAVELSEEQQRELIVAAYGCTGAEKVATDFALKHLEFSKKFTLRTLKELAVYEKRDGFGLRKRYFPKPEVSTRLKLDEVALGAALKIQIEREALEAKQAAQAAALAAAQQALTQANSAAAAPVPVSVPAAAPIAAMAAPPQVPATFTLLHVNPAPAPVSATAPVPAPRRVVLTPLSAPPAMQAMMGKMTLTSSAPQTTPLQASSSSAPKESKEVKEAKEIKEIKEAKSPEKKPAVAITNFFSKAALPSSPAPDM